MGVGGGRWRKGPDEAALAGASWKQLQPEAPTLPYVWPSPQFLLFSSLTHAEKPMRKMVFSI